MAGRLARHGKFTQHNKKGLLRPAQDIDTTVDQHTDEGQKNNGNDDVHVIHPVAVIPAALSLRRHQTEIVLQQRKGCGEAVAFG